MSLCRSGRSDGLFETRLGTTVDQVVEDRSAKEKRLLQDNSDVLAERWGGQVSQVDAIQQHSSLIHIVKSAEQIHQGGFATATSSDDADPLAGFNCETDILQDGAMAFIAKGDILEPDFSLEVCECRFLVRLFRFDRGIQQFKDAMAACQKTGEPGCQL